MDSQPSTLPVRRSLDEGGSSQLDAEILRVWIAERRAILQREGCAVRAGDDNTIEVQLINSPLRQFAPLTLPDGRTHCATAEERDAILAQLQVPQVPTEPAQGILFRETTSGFVPYVRHHLAHL